MKVAFVLVIVFAAVAAQGFGAGNHGRHPAPNGGQPRDREEGPEGRTSARSGDGRGYRGGPPAQTGNNNVVPPTEIGGTKEGPPAGDGNSNAVPPTEIVGTNEGPRGHRVGSPSRDGGDNAEIAHRGPFRRPFDRFSHEGPRHQLHQQGRRPDGPGRRHPGPQSDSHGHGVNSGENSAGHEASDEGTNQNSNIEVVSGPEAAGIERDMGPEATEIEQGASSEFTIVQQGINAGQGTGAEATYTEQVTGPEAAGIQQGTDADATGFEQGTGPESTDFVGGTSSMDTERVAAVYADSE